MKIKRFLVLLIILAVLVVVLVKLLGFLGDYYWFSNLGYDAIFVKILLTQVILFIILFIITFAFLKLNFTIAEKLSPLVWSKRLLENVELEVNISKIFKYISLFISLFISFVYANMGYNRWDTVLKFINRQLFQITDPIFNKNVSFFTFTLPFLKFVRSYLMGIIVLSIIISLVYYLFKGLIKMQSGSSKVQFAKNVKVHISILLSIFFLLLCAGNLFSIYDLVFSSEGVVFGAGYSDIHGLLLGYRILMAVSIITAIFALLNTFLKTSKIFIISLIAYIAASVFFVGIYPGIIQKFVVVPNELQKESPYIEKNIKYTRIAYCLDTIEEKEYEVTYDLTYDKVMEQSETVNNIRLWDWRPLVQTYRQLQEIRLYYDFPSVDIDRYMLDGEYREVMLSPREMNIERIPQQAKTWVNEHLKYTHGYGLCLSPVSKVTEDGQPLLLIKDIPPVSLTSIEIERPEIYFGKKTNDYVIVNTNTKEFNYPLGDKNEYTVYEGSSGVEMSGFLRRIIYALKFGSIDIIFSKYINKESRIVFSRNIIERVNKIAPFLKQDSDPYLVISEGRLFWIMDAYTVTDKFPYSEPVGSFNYIRNSVKIVIDAYNGSVDFYLIDDEDPVALTYGAIFPGLFKPFSEMPEDLKKHLRYPEDYFSIQTRMITAYHMLEPEVFYNKEDVWNIPNELYQSVNQPVAPYYVVMSLPGEEKAEFIIMIPFTPAKKNNMISWLCGRSDGEHYGKLLLYKFPKQKLIYGPSQIEAKIDQNTTISQMLTLWSQKGSNVIRGNLLVIPIKGSILYVEPLFLQAAQSQLPELKRVLLSYENRVVMAETFQEALVQLFEESPGSEEYTEYDTPPTEVKPGVLNNADQALEHYNRALDFLKSGNWESFGKEMDKLKTTLEKMATEAESNVNSEQ
ncbi:UPF0182 family protein [bacterium]|nr:UPF0182 family protein [bacterium]